MVVARVGGYFRRIFLRVDEGRGRGERRRRRRYAQRHGETERSSADCTIDAVGEMAW